MEGTAALSLRPRTDAEYQAAINGYLEEMKHMIAEMAVTRAQIEQDRRETEATLARLEALI